jgi:hypothetical protein
VIQVGHWIFQLDERDDKSIDEDRTGQTSIIIQSGISNHGVRTAAAQQSQIYLRPCVRSHPNVHIDGYKDNYS